MSISLSNSQLKVSSCTVLCLRSEFHGSLCLLSSLQGGGLLIEDIFTEGNAFLDGRLSEGTYIGTMSSWCHSLHINHTHMHTRARTHSLPTAKYISVVLLLLCAIAGDIIVQIDRQDLSHMTLAQATLALGTSSPLIKLGVYRPSVEDSTFVQLLPRITHTHRVSVYMCTYWRANSVVCTVEPLIRAPSEIGTTSLQMTLVSIPC